MGVGGPPSDDVDLNDFTENQGKDAEAGRVNMDDLMQKAMEDEFADSDNEVSPSVYRTTGRKFRIVDLEDEE